MRKKSAREAMIFVSVFLHLLTNRRIGANFKISTTIFDLLRKIWRIKIQNNFSNVFHQVY